MHMLCYLCVIVTYIYNSASYDVTLHCLNRFPFCQMICFQTSWNQIPFPHDHYKRAPGTESVHVLFQQVWPSVQTGKWNHASTGCYKHGEIPEEVAHFTQRCSLLVLNSLCEVNSIHIIWQRIRQLRFKKVFRSFIKLALNANNYIQGDLYSYLRDQSFEGERTIIPQQVGMWPYTCTTVYQSYEACVEMQHPECVNDESLQIRQLCGHDDVCKTM